MGYAWELLRDLVHSGEEGCGEQNWNLGDHSAPGWEFQASRIHLGLGSE